VAKSDLGQERRFRVISVIFPPWPDVRFDPQSDRDSDMPDGRSVPIPTKVQRSKTTPPFDHLVDASDRWLSLSES
jgi:hypothetical protein